MPSRRPLVLHVTNIPTPYRLPYLRAVRRRLEDEGIDLHVFFLGRGKRTREWRIDAEELAGFESTLHAGGDPVRAVKRTLRERRPDAVVLAWAMDPAALRLLLACVLRRIPTVLFTGETSAAAAGRTYPWLRGLVRRPFFRLADAFLTYGTCSTEYLRRHRVPPERITTGLNVVDTDFFRDRVDALRRSGRAAVERDRLRRSDGEAFACHLLLVGYMIPGKGVSSTLRALAAIDRPDITLHLVGTGEREQAHRELTEQLGLSSRVFFHGYRQTDEMPLFYALADVVLFPSFVDVFGLVMSEAAAAALPVIASPHSGGTVDVVVDGTTGLVVDPSDTRAYADAIVRLADDPALRASMGAAGREHATTRLTLGQSAERYAQAVRRVVRMC